MTEQREPLKPNDTHHCLLRILASSRDDVIVHDPIVPPRRDVRRADIVALLTERAQLLEVAGEVRLLVAKVREVLAEDGGGLPDPNVLDDQLFLTQLKLDTLDGKQLLATEVG